MIIGIDPGREGALAFLTDTGRLLAVHDMPVMPDNKKWKVDGAELARIIESEIQDYCIESLHDPMPVAFIERVGAMPGQGVSSMFQFGRSLGAVEGVLMSMNFPLHYVTPQRWKKLAGLIGQPKDAARGRALELYPNADVRLKKHTGRADAILIGHFGQL